MATCMDCERDYSRGNQFRCSPCLAKWKQGIRERARSLNNGKVK